MAEPQINEPAREVPPVVPPPVEEQKTPAARWWWDPPKLIPILISVLALIISGLGWYESHRVRRINEEINRPILSISSIKYEVSREKTPDSAGVLVSLNIRLKNTGKFTAKLYKYGVEAYLPSLHHGPCIEFPLGGTTAEFPMEVVPGMEFTIPEHAYINDSIEPECRKFPIKITVRISAHYYEENSDKPYYQNLIEEIEIPKNIPFKDAKIRIE